MNAKKEIKLLLDQEELIVLRAALSYFYLDCDNMSKRFNHIKTLQFFSETKQTINKMLKALPENI